MLYVWTRKFLKLTVMTFSEPAKLVVAAYNCLHIFGALLQYSNLANYLKFHLQN